MELTKDESKRILRRIELEAYSALVTALRAQGELDREKKRLLLELGEQLSISTERHRAEIRRAISDDRLSMIAECVCGSDASVEWESEGRRVVPLMPRLVPQTAFTGAATAAANHAASVNSTISSSLKGRTKDRDEEEKDAKARKRQRTTSPKPVQKVIVSPIHKTTVQNVSTVTSAGHSANVTPKETATFFRTSTFPTKQENSSSPLSSVSMKINSSHSGSSVHQMTSKPIILGGSKSTSSVSVASAANKHVAPLPASCLQAHASVVSGNKNRTKLNLVKQKPKPKFKPLAATVKIKTLSPIRQNASALQSLSTDKNKANEVSTSMPKTIQAPRNTASITVPPRSSISLTTFKNSLQQKPKSQSPPGIVRNIETASRHASGLTKVAPVPRLPRPLPAILPKSIPPKSISTVSSPGRKLASILPAPAKSAISTLANPVILPVVASSSTTSPPIPIAPSPRLPQSFRALSSTVLSKVSSVSLTSTPSTVFKRGTAPYTSESAVSSAVLPESATVASKNSSPSLSRQSKESIHERETLSPVSDILTLVTSPSSVPFVSSSPVKSKPLTTIRSAVNEISLKCDEKLSEVKDFLKEEEVELEGFRSLFDTFPSSSTKLPQEGGGSQIPKTTLRNDSLQTLNKPDHNILQLSQRSPVKAVPTELCLQKPGKKDTKVTQDISDDANKTNGVASSGLDLSPLVDELLSSNSLLTEEKHLKDTSDVSNPPFSVHTTAGVSCEGTNKDVQQWTGFECTILDVQKNEQINLGNKSCRNLEIIEEKSGVVYVDNVNASVRKDFDHLALTTKDIEEQGKTDNIQEETELKDDDPKVVVQMEKTVDLKSKEVIREYIPVAEKENLTQVDKLSHLKKQEEPIEMVINATEPVERSDESSVLVSENENENSIIKGDLKSLEKTNSLKGNINSDISVIAATEKVVVLHEPRLLKPEKLDENLHLKKMESAQLSVSATKPVEQLSDSFSTWEQKTEQKTESEFLDGQTTGTVEQAAKNYLTIDEKDNEQFFVGPIKNQRLLDGASKATKSEVALSAPDSSVSRSLSSGISNIAESLTTEHQVENPPRDHETGSRQESGEEQHSGSDTGSTEGAFIRTSGRKRKAPPPRDLSLVMHPPGWIRSALHVLQRVSRFRGNARLKGEPSAASWFLKPVETTDAPGYHKIVKYPMDFGTIKSKLETAKYSDHIQFHSDMLLIKTNCYKYNPPGHDVRRDCDEVFQFYEVEYEKFSEKLEKCHLFSPKKARPLFGGNESK